MKARRRRTILGGATSLLQKMPPIGVASPAPMIVGGITYMVSDPEEIVARITQQTITKGAPFTPPQIYAIVLQFIDSVLRESRVKGDGRELL